MCGLMLGINNQGDAIYYYKTRKPVEVKAKDLKDGDIIEVGDDVLIEAFVKSTPSGYEIVDCDDNGDVDVDPDYTCWCYGRAAE